MLLRLLLLLWIWEWWWWWLWWCRCGVVKAWVGGWADTAIGVAAVVAVVVVFVVVVVVVIDTGCRRGVTNRNALPPAVVSSLPPPSPPPLADVEPAESSAVSPTPSNEVILLWSCLAVVTVADRTFSHFCFKDAVRTTWATSTRRLYGTPIDGTERDVCYASLRATDEGATECASPFPVFDLITYLLSTRSATTSLFASAERLIPFYYFYLRIVLHLSLDDLCCLLDLRRHFYSHHLLSSLLNVPIHMQHILELTDNNIDWRPLWNKFLRAERCPLLGSG